MKLLKKFLLLNLTAIFALTLLLSSCASENPPNDATKAADNAATSESAGGLSEPQETEAEPQSSTEDDGYMETEGFVFIYNGVNFYLGENLTRVLSELGPENDYYEFPSCSFEGTSKIYYYNGFELANYLRDTQDCDRLYSITLTDDSVSTLEGISIGQSVDDMLSLYGVEYEQLVEGSYRYIKAGTVLSFGAEDGIITSILYSINEIYE